MNVVKSFHADGYLPAGLVLNARLASNDPDGVVPILSPLGRFGVAQKLVCPLEQANDSTMIRLKGKISGAVILGSLEDATMRAPTFIDFDPSVSAPVRMIDPIHDPCVLMTPMRYTGEVVILNGIDAPLADMVSLSNWSVKIKTLRDQEWVPTLGALSVPSVLYLGSGLSRSIYSATHDVLNVLFSQRGLEVAKASEDWLAIAPTLEDDIKAIVAMTEIPNYPKLPYQFEIDHPSGESTSSDPVMCIRLAVGENVQAGLEDANLEGAALMADPAKSVMPFSLIPGTRNVGLFSGLGLAALFTPDTTDWVGVPMARESMETNFTV